MSVPSVCLVVLDGWGLAPEGPGNAVALADTPVMDGIWAERPHTTLTACGESVGLPAGQMGNSEVGHLNIGAGRVVMQELPRIGLAVATGSLAQKPELLALIEAVRQSGGVCHLMGLVSPGGVHAHQDHAVALARILAAAGIQSAPEAECKTAEEAIAAAEKPSSSTWSLASHVHTTSPCRSTSMSRSSSSGASATLGRL